MLQIYHSRVVSITNVSAPVLLCTASAHSNRLFSSGFHDSEQPFWKYEMGIQSENSQKHKPAKRQLRKIIQRAVQNKKFEQPSSFQNLDKLLRRVRHSASSRSYSRFNRPAVVNLLAIDMILTKHFFGCRSRRQKPLGMHFKILFISIFCCM